MLLRPRQKALVSKTIDALHKHGNTLAVAPTGSGKTIMFSAVLGQMFKRGIRRACVIAHRDELTHQNADKFKRVNPELSTCLINAHQKEWNGQVACAMVQTLSRPKNLNSLPKIDVLVIDEAHHATENSYLSIVKHARRLNPDLKLLGMTATTIRGDGKGLHRLFSNVADQIMIKELVASGHLVPPRTFVMDIGVQESLRLVHKTKTDYDMIETAKIMNKRPLNDAVVEHWSEKAAERQTVVFCSTVDHARDVMKGFQRAGVAAGMLWNEMSAAARAGTIDAYNKGNLRVIINVAILTEGWDHPPTSCVVLLRPNSHKSTMIQMIGRGLRTVDPAEFPGVVKKDCIVMDFGTSTLLHGSLEQEIDLEDQFEEGMAPYKDCPGCGAAVPLATKECPLCGFVWLRQPAPYKVKAADFQMKEVLILDRSNFKWCDLDDDGKNFIATGFKAWSGVFSVDSEWYAVGAREGTSAQLLARGERVVCFAAADDWINLYETESNAHKKRSWLNNKPTSKQMPYIPQKYHNDAGLTRYKASALLTMEFNRRDIDHAIKSGKSAA